MKLALKHSDKNSEDGLCHKNLKVAFLKMSHVEFLILKIASRTLEIILRMECGNFLKIASIPFKPRTSSLFYYFRLILFDFSRAFKIRAVESIVVKSRRYYYLTSTCIT